MSIEDVFDLPTVISGLGVERKQRPPIVYRDDSASRDDFFFGIPKEGYGFSNDAKAWLGAPTFSRQASST